MAGSVDTSDATDARRTLAQLEQRARRMLVEHDGRRVCWRGFGAGPPVVLLHGGHGSWMHWVRNIDALAREHQVWVPDMPGYGDSDSPAGRGLEHLVDDLLATLDAVVGPATPIALAAFSFGALAAAQLCARRGGLERLALLGAAGHGGPRRPRGELTAWREADKAGDALALARAMRHNLWVHMLYAPQAIDALALAVHTASCRRARFYSRPISRAGGLADALRQYAGPVTLVWGEHDVTAEPAAAAAALSEGARNCRTHVVAGAGHWVQYEGAEAVNRLLLEWLADHH